MSENCVRIALASRAHFRGQPVVPVEGSDLTSVDEGRQPIKTSGARRASGRANVNRWRGMLSQDGCR
jgi:hypothetical protein